MDLTVDRDHPVFEAMLKAGYDRPLLLELGQLGRSHEQGLPRKQTITTYQELGRPQGTKR
jgi:hypothetical protein